jgi:hypothetical protein
MGACGRESTAPAADAPVPQLTSLNSTPGIPLDWIGFLGQPTSFAVGEETANAHGGVRAAYLASVTPTPVDSTFATIDQFIQAQAYLGKRVRLSAWVRAVNIVLPTAAAAADGKPAPVSGLWMRIDGYGTLLGFDNMQKRPVIGTTGWQQVSIVLDVPTYAIGIAFGALFSGMGELLVDDMVLETVSTSVPTTDMNAGVVNVPGDPEATVTTYSTAPVAPSNLDFELAIHGASATRTTLQRGSQRY